MKRDTRVLRIQLNKIQADPQQVRRRFEQEAMTALVLSLEHVGLIHPIEVRRLEVGEAREQAQVEYQIVHGETRYRAYRQLHDKDPEDERWTAIDALDITAELKKEDGVPLLLKQLHSNNVAARVDILDQADMLLRLVKSGEISGGLREVAKRLALPAERVRLLRKLGAMPAAVRGFARPVEYEVSVRKDGKKVRGADGKFERKKELCPGLSAGHLRALIMVYEHFAAKPEYKMAKNDQIHPEVERIIGRLGRKAQRERLSVAELDRRCAVLRDKDEAAPASEPTPSIRSVLSAGRKFEAGLRDAYASLEPEDRKAARKLLSELVAIVGKTSRERDLESKLTATQAELETARAEAEALRAAQQRVNGAAPRVRVRPRIPAFRTGSETQTN